MAKRVFRAVAALALAFAATTWWALESGGIAVIATRAPDGSVRSTHVWFVESDGELWLEAGSPENAWYRDVREDGSVGFEVDGRSARYVARPSDEARSHFRIRSLIHEKYGFRDRWVGWIVDTSRSVAVRLVPDDGSANRAAPKPERRGAARDAW